MAPNLYSLIFTGTVFFLAVSTKSMPSSMSSYIRIPSFNPEEYADLSCHISSDMSYSCRRQVAVTLPLSVIVYSLCKDEYRVYQRVCQCSLYKDEQGLSESMLVLSMWG